MTGIAINVGANTTLPGFRAPIYRDGTFRYVPIPERQPTRSRVPTYADLNMPDIIPPAHRETRIHLDPEFAEYANCEAYTYGDEHGVKATPLAALRRGDLVFFYATLESCESPRYGWIPPEWGAYVIGHFRLAEDPVVDGHEQGLSTGERDRFASNAHLKRETMDARVLIRGHPDRSRIYDVAVPLSHPDDGSKPGPIVTAHTTDSGRGPWWRRPLRIPDPGPILERIQ